jgi:hypothetical protein
MTLPLAKISTFEQTASTSGKVWVLSTTVAPRPVAISRKMPST